MVAVGLAAVGGAAAWLSAQDARPADAPPDAGDVAALRAAYALPPERWPPATWDEAIAPADRRELGPLPAVGHPAANPHSKAKADLGWTLFFDPRLSGSGQVSCASCHHPDTGWADGRVNSLGHDAQPGRRNAPGLLNVGLREFLMWDGRAAALEDQALIPITAHDEMRAEPEAVLARLREQPAYREQFRLAFGDPADGDDAITMSRVAASLATFQRTITSNRGRFEAFLNGKHEALSDDAVRGLHLFRTAARCINCHSGPTLSDGRFHDLGLSYYGRTLEDLGRHRVSGRPEDVGRFATPPLRNVTRTSPYMHNGLFELPGVLNLYDVGMPTVRPKPAQQGDPLFPTKSPLLRPLNLSDRDKADLTAFLESLAEPRLRVRPPTLPGHDPTGRTYDLFGAAPDAGPTAEP